MTGLVAAPRTTPAPAVFMATATCAAVTLTAMFGFSWALPNGPDMTNVSPLASIVIGLSMAFVVLTIPATAWGWMVAKAAGQPARQIIRTTIRVALPTFAIVGIAVDLSQFFIGYVRRWHRLAVHGLFALSFAVGMAVFLGVVTWRIARVISVTNGTGSGVTPARVGQRVALATGLGVIAGAFLALPLGWAVVGGMGRRMLAPLYLVLSTGTFAGGFMFGRWLARIDPTHSSRETSDAESNRATPDYSRNEARG